MHQDFKQRLASIKGEHAEVLRMAAVKGNLTSKDMCFILWYEYGMRRWYHAKGG